jgi:transcriptional regulator with XRE-family HTH domain
MSSDIKRIEDNERKQLNSYFSTRSILYSIEPEGVGTPYVESLASYISRLAINHNLSLITLFKEVIIQHTNMTYLKNEQNTGIILTEMKGFINENSIITMECVNAISDLTKRRDIHYLTMLNWKGFFNRNIRDRGRKWCPSCLNQMLLKSKVIYEPLIWSLSDVKKCDIHETQLKDKCPNCKRKLPFAHSRLEVGFCQYCRAWLGDLGDPSEKKPLSNNENFIILNYKQLIESGPDLEFYPTKNSFGDLLNRIKTELGFKSIASFAEFLEFNSATVWEWLNNKYVPTHESLLKIASKLNTTIYNLFYNKNIKLDIDKNVYCNKKRRKSIPLNEIEYHLRKSIDLDEPKSLYSIAQEEGFDSSKAKYNFPILCEKIINNYKIYQQQQRLNKQKEIEAKLNNCLREEVPISLKQFSIKYEVTIRTVRRYAPDLCKKVVLRYKEYISELKEDRISKITSEIKKVVIDLHQRGIKPSIWNVQKKMGNKGLFLEDKVRDIWREIVSSLGYKF